MTNVKNYSDQQILDRIKTLPGFKHFPSNFWIVGIRSTEDANDVFDDKFYFFKGEEFISVTSGTTNKGNKGTAVMLEGIYYDSYSYGLHRGKMPALRQIKGIKYRRDFTNDLKTNPTTEIFSNVIGMNIHACSYDLTLNVVKKNIGGWSEGCQVMNNIKFYSEIFIPMIKKNGFTTYVLLNEF